MVDKINKIFNNKYSMALFVIGILWIIAVVIGFSYALWKMNHTQSGSNSLATSCFEINFVETSESINLANAAPLSDEKGLRTVPYEFKVVNKCDQFYNYEITLDIIDANTTLDLSKVKVTLDGADTLTPTILSTLPTAIEEEAAIRTSYILGSGELDYQEEKTYQLRLWLDETSTQTEMNKLFEGRVTIKNVQAVKPGTLKVSEKTNETITTLEAESFLGSPIQRQQIEELEFVSNQEVPVGVTGSWDVSALQDGSVIAWYAPVGSNGRYKVTIGTKASRIIANEDSSFLFRDLRNLNSLNFNDKLETTNAKDMNNLFAYTGLNSTIFTLDLGNNFDTSNVTNMSNMFSVTGRYSTLFTLDLKDKFATSKVTDMSAMFFGTGQYNPTFTLNLGTNFNTSKVTNMYYMFGFVGQHSTVLSLDLSGFDTSNVITTEYMFGSIGQHNPNFTLDVSSFNTSKVTNMKSMFSGTATNNSNFTLDLSNFNTNNVTNMETMFYETGGTNFTVNLSSFDTSNVTNMTRMFDYVGSDGRMILDLSSFDFGKVTEISRMFASEVYAISSIYVKDSASRNFIENNRTEMAMRIGITVIDCSTSTVC